jgi:hypothetical protein
MRLLVHGLSDFDQFTIPLQIFCPTLNPRYLAVKVPAERVTMENEVEVAWDQSVLLCLLDPLSIEAVGEYPNLMSRREQPRDCPADCLFRALIWMTSDGAEKNAHEKTWPRTRHSSRIVRQRFLPKRRLAMCCSTCLSRVVLQSACDPLLGKPSPRFPLAAQLNSSTITKPHRIMRRSSPPPPR